MSVPVTGYASVADFELRTGTDVPPNKEDTVQQRLNDVSSLIDVYLGDCADEVANAYPDVLTMIAVSSVYRTASMPVGVRSESVGSTSVTYDTDSGPLSLLASETDLLDALIAGACGPDSSHDGVGQVGIGYGGAPEYDNGWPEDVDLWVLHGRAAL